MRVLRSRKVMAIAGIAFVAGALAATSVAAVISQVVVTDTNNLRLRVVTTEADGFDSVWHTHPGLVVVQVREGYFKLYQGGCTPTVVGPGETYIEVPNVAVRAIAKDSIAWTTTMILPQGPAPGTNLPPGADPYGCPQLGPNP